MATKEKLPARPAPRRKRGEPQRLRLLSVELGGWPALGGTVLLELGPRRTVLVGRNGAGKSLLLEGLFGARARILRGALMEGPDQLQCTFEYEQEQRLQYHYGVEGETADLLEPSFAVHESAEGLPRWEERCWNPRDRKVLWRTASGQVHLPGAPPVLVPTWSGLLVAGQPKQVPEEAHAIRAFFRNMGMVAAGLPRTTLRVQRRPVFVPPPQSREPHSPSEQTRIEHLAHVLLSWRSTDPERFSEFVELGRQMGVWQEVEASTYGRRESSGVFSNSDDFISLLFDGTNIGLLPDGTLRILSILCGLLETRPGGLLLLEEPETGIHPGLLARLLAVLESYSMDCQLLISTQSPQLVSWAAPQEIRLVQRQEGVTRVSSLSEQQIQQLAPYLQERGTLADFIYGGGVDG